MKIGMILAVAALAVAGCGKKDDGTKPAAPEAAKPAAPATAKAAETKAAPVDPKAVAVEVNGKKVINAFSFGPAMIINDEVVLNVDSAPTMSNPGGRAQRMVIAQLGPLQYMVVSCRQVGCTAEEMVSLVQSLADHIEVAYFMDGGQSSQMVFMGTLVNKNERDARTITDIIYFASAYQED